MMMDVGCQHYGFLANKWYTIYLVVRTIIKKHFDHAWATNKGVELKLVELDNRNDYRVDVTDNGKGLDVLK